MMTSHGSRRVTLVLLLAFVASLVTLDLHAAKTETTVTGIVKVAELYGSKVRSVFIRNAEGEEFLVVRGTTIGKKLLAEVGSTVKATGYVKPSQVRGLDFSQKIDVLEFEVVPEAAKSD